MSCGVAAAAGPRVLQYASGAKKPVDGKGEERNGSKYKSGAGKRREGTGGDTNGMKTKRRGMK